METQLWSEFYESRYRNDYILAKMRTEREFVFRKIHFWHFTTIMNQELAKLHPVHTYIFYLKSIIQGD